jgi:hypothetical protein
LRSEVKAIVDELVRHGYSTSYVFMLLQGLLIVNKYWHVPLGQVRRLPPPEVVCGGPAAFTRSQAMAAAERALAEESEQQWGSGSQQGTPYEEEYGEYDEYDEYDEGEGGEADDAGEPAEATEDGQEGLGEAYEVEEAEQEEVGGQQRESEEITDVAGAPDGRDDRSAVGDGQGGEETDVLSEGSDAHSVETERIDERTDPAPATGHSIAVASNTVGQSSPVAAPAPQSTVGVAGATVSDCAEVAASSAGSSVTSADVATLAAGSAVATLDESATVATQDAVARVDGIAEVSVAGSGNVAAGGAVEADAEGFTLVRRKRRSNARYTRLGAEPDLAARLQASSFFSTPARISASSAVHGETQMHAEEPPVAIMASPSDAGGEHSHQQSQQSAAADADADAQGSVKAVRTGESGGEPAAPESIAVNARDSEGEAKEVKAPTTDSIVAGAGGTENERTNVAVPSSVTAVASADVATLAAENTVAGTGGTVEEGANLTTQDVVTAVGEIADVSLPATASGINAAGDTAEADAEGFTQVYRKRCFNPRYTRTGAEENLAARKQAASLFGTPVHSGDSGAVHGDIEGHADESPATGEASPVDAGRAQSPLQTEQPPDPDADTQDDEDEPDETVRGLPEDANEVLLQDFMSEDDVQYLRGLSMLRKKVFMELIRRAHALSLKSVTLLNKVLPRLLYIRSKLLPDVIPEVHHCTSTQHHLNVANSCCSGLRSCRYPQLILHRLQGTNQQTRSAAAT